MKKNILIFSLIFVFSNPMFASINSATLDKIENSLYGFQYNDDDETRLTRLENTVYGITSSGSIANRISKLKKDVSADQIGNEITPTEDTFADESDSWVADEPVADANIQYPAVDELERLVFNQIFQTKDIKARLSALEEKTFSRSYSDDLATRVDRLKAELKPRSFMDNLIAQSSNDFYYDDVVPLEKNYHLERYDSPTEFDYDSYNLGKTRGSFVRKANISTVENSVLKRAYQHDNMQNRLGRLENAMFGTQFNDEDEQTRINRISSAYAAQKSATKYDNNKFTQNMSTAVQIGSMLLMILACIL